MSRITHRTPPVQVLWSKLVNDGWTLHKFAQCLTKTRDMESMEIMNFFYPVEIDREASTVAADSPPYLCTLGDEVVCRVVVRGSPAPQCQWLHSTERAGRAQVVAHGNELRYPCFQAECAGYYRFVAQNYSRTADISQMVSLNFKLELQPSPMILQSIGIKLASLIGMAAYTHCDPLNSTVGDMRAMVKILEAANVLCLTAVDVDLESCLILDRLYQSIVRGAANLPNGYHSVMYRYGHGYRLKCLEGHNDRLMTYDFADVIDEVVVDGPSNQISATTMGLQHDTRRANMYQASGNTTRCANANVSVPTPAASKFKRTYLVNAANTYCVQCASNAIGQCGPVVQLCVFDLCRWFESTDDGEAHEVCPQAVPASTVVPHNTVTITSCGIKQQSVVVLSENTSMCSMALRKHLPERKSFWDTVTDVKREVQSLVDKSKCRLTEDQRAVPYLDEHSQDGHKRSIHDPSASYDETSDADPLNVILHLNSGPDTAFSEAHPRDYNTVLTPHGSSNSSSSRPRHQPPPITVRYRTWHELHNVLLLQFYHGGEWAVDETGNDVTTSPGGDVIYLYGGCVSVTAVHAAACCGREVVSLYRIVFHWLGQLARLLAADTRTAVGASRVGRAASLRRYDARIDLPVRRIIGGAGRSDVRGRVNIRLPALVVAALDHVRM